MIHIIRERATSDQINEMLEALGIYIKVAVDVENAILAGGGAAHYDCEQALLNEGSIQSHIWGADWTPSRRRVAYESIINIRPRINNSMEILDSKVREQVAQIIFSRLGAL
jgi:Protein of unknown function (DUF5674)